MNLISRVAGLVAALCLAGMVLVVIAAIVARPFGRLVPSSDEITTFLMVGMAFFGFVYAYREGAHVRVDTLFCFLPAGTKHVLEILSHSAAAALALALTIYSGELTRQAYIFHDLSDGLLAIPMWIPMIAMPIGFALFALALAYDGIRICRRERVVFAISERDEALSLVAERQDGGTQR